jgi:hypothetical protein
MPEIVKLHNGMFDYELPPLPTREEDVLFYDKKKKDQFWITPTLPDFKRLSLLQRIQFIETERQRWHEGCWFFNNGEPTYITGIHYDHLVNMTFEEGKAFYLDSQRKDFYFRDLTWKDPFCKGRVWAKPRRYGMSMEEMTEATYRGMEDFERHVGLISIEERKTKKTLFNPIVDSFFKRPKYSRPVAYKPNSKKPKQELKFSSNDIPLDVEDQLVAELMELNGWILPFPTDAAAMDAFKMHYITADEVWKWQGVSPREFLETQLLCLMRGGELIGLISMLSTLGDTKDQKKAIEDGIYIYKNSNPLERDANGFTKTGLYPYFVSAIYAKFKFRDQYGFIDEGRAEEEIWNDRATVEEGSEEWVKKVRKEPLTEEEAMATAEGTSTFDSVRIQSQMTIIEKTPKKDLPFIEGAELIEETNGKVHMEDTGKGYWIITKQPKVKKLSHEDRSNRWKKTYDEFLKMNKSPEGAIGYDPVRYGDEQTVSSNVSKAAIVAKYKFDYFGNNCANRYAGLFIHRDEDPDMAHYEALKAAKFWGFPIMYERQVDSVLKYFKDMKALDFLLKNPKDNKYGLWTDNNKKVVKHGVDRFQAYIKRPKKSDEIDYLKEINLLPLLKDAKNFDPAHTRKFDAFMANVMLEHALEQIYFTNELDEMEDTDDEKAMLGRVLFGIV